MSIRSWAHAAGLSLGVAGLVFVVAKLAGYRRALDAASLPASIWAIVAILAVCHFAAGTLLAEGWRRLLTSLGVRTRRRSSLRLYGLSQLAKYVPGNVFHLAGRQALGAAQGLPAWPLAKSAAWELGLVAVAGAVFAVLGAPLTSTRVSVVASVAIFSVSLTLLLVVMWQWRGADVSKAVLCHTAYFMICGGTFFILLRSIAPDAIEGRMLTPIAGVYAVAFLAGFVAPGAPAGVGVRELVLYGLLLSIVREVDLLRAIVLGRVVTVGGDVLFYLTAVMLRDDVDGWRLDAGA